MGYKKIEVVIPESIYNLFLDYVRDKNIETFIKPENKVKWLFSSILYDRLEYYSKILGSLQKYSHFKGQ